MKRFPLLAAVFFSMNAYAFFCPGNFNVVSPGATLEDVKRICGSPDSEQTYALSAANAVSKWEYVKASAFNSFTSQIIFSLNDNKVVNITIVKGSDEAIKICQATHLAASPNFQVWCNNPGPYTVANTNLCGGVVHIGDSAQVVEYLCGKPLTVRQEGTDDPSKMVTEYVYSGATPMTFVFMNGQLKEKR